MHFRQLEMIPWYGFIVYWLISAARLKQVKVEEAPQGRIVHILIMVAAVDFMFWGNFSVGTLNQRIIPIDLRILDTGIALTWVGIAFAIWARHTIGANWSGRVTVKVDHQLIQSGPYAFVRHPIYSGILTGVLGTALATNLIGLIIVGVLGAYFYYSASVEEKNLTATFPTAYPAYRARTKMLIPFLL